MGAWGLPVSANQLPNSVATRAFPQDVVFTLQGWSNEFTRGAVALASD